MLEYMFYRTFSFMCLKLVLLMIFFHIFESEKYMNSFGVQRYSDKLLIFTTLNEGKSCMFKNNGKDSHVFTTFLP